MGGPTDLAPLLDVTNPRAECFPSQKPEHMDHRSRSLRPVGEEGLPESIRKMFQLFHSSGALPRLTIPAQRTRRKPITVYTDASSDHHQTGIGFVFIDTEPNETRLMSDGATPPELLELFGARGSVINRAEPRHRVPRPQAHAAVPVKQPQQSGAPSKAIPAVFPSRAQDGFSTAERRSRVQCPTDHLRRVSVASLA